MRTTRHLYSTGSATLLACLTALATGCSGDLGGTGEMSPPPTATGVGGSNPATSGSGTTGVSTNGGRTGGTGGNPLPSNVCAPGIAETSQVARLKNSHYDNIMRD